MVQKVLGPPLRGPSSFLKKQKKVLAPQEKGRDQEESLQDNSHQDQWERERQNQQDQHPPDLEMVKKIIEQLNSSTFYLERQLIFKLEYHNGETWVEIQKQKEEGMIQRLTLHQFLRIGKDFLMDSKKAPKGKIIDVKC